MLKKTLRAVDSMLIYNGNELKINSTTLQVFSLKLERFLVPIIFYQKIKILINISRAICQIKSRVISSSIIRVMLDTI